MNRDRLRRRVRTAAASSTEQKPNAVGIHLPSSVVSDHRILQSSAVVSHPSLSCRVALIRLKIMSLHSFVCHKRHAVLVVQISTGV